MTNHDLISKITEYVEANIGSFHAKRLQTVRKKKLHEVLKRKNPYLFKTKHTQTASELIKGIMDAFISSQEETLFGDFLESVAVFVNGQVYGGYKPAKSELTGIDLVFENDDKVFVVEIKSGPHWGNSSQISKMVLNFREAINRLAPQFPHKTITPINGCMYGTDASPDKVGKIKENGEVIDTIPYTKLCGQDFWYFISGIEALYLDIIEPLGYRAKQRSEEFQIEYTKLLNKFERAFLNIYCDDDGAIMWQELVAFVSKNESAV